MYLEKWCQRGKSHREGGPAYVESIPNKYGHDIIQRRREEWLIDGLLHRNDGPAITVTDSDGIAVLEAWFQNGLLHREDGPSQIERDMQTERVVTELWHSRGQLHRENGPAVINTDWETGHVIREQYFIRGKLHREQEGFADITYDRISGVWTKRSKFSFGHEIASWVNAAAPHPSA
ncbi:hypothetical protein RMQ97_13305 [Maricaulis sp. D1M11]|uniref:hypothetical protein n=1 Tax=Maricaulis sp. D1M11 TaxID=3076117 RepID=UPI0039B6C377